VELLSVHTLSATRGLRRAGVMSRHIATLLSRARLGLRLFLLLALAILVITMATDVWRLQQERQRVLGQLQREASLVAQSIERPMLPLLQAARDRRLMELLEDIREAKGAECVGIYSLAGRRIQAAFGPRGEPAHPDVCPSEVTPQPVAEAVSAQWGLSGTYNLQVPLTPNDTPQAILKLVFEMARVSAPLQALRNSILVERALALAAIGLVLWVGIAFSVTRPIRRLIHGVDAIGQGHLDARIASTSRTEIGELARAFNHMAASLAEAQHQRHEADERRARAERQLRHAERLAAVGKLASVIAHEVGTPLHVIAGRARILGRTLSEDDPRHHDVATIREQVGRITRTMQQVLQSSRALPARHEPVDAGRLVREVATIAAPDFAARRVHLGLALPSDLPVIPADGDGLTQVLLNLLMNAVAATEAGGQVGVSGAVVHRDGRAGIAICVTDTGMGIAPEDLGRIFDPFFSTKGSGGTGLGLSICRDIVRAHEGTITVESTPGAGARFTIWLPGDRREARRA
jgi:two-component system NtrC family sensor kinase